MSSSQDDSGTVSGRLMWRTQLSDIYKLIVEHVDEDRDDSPATLSAHITTLLSQDSFAVPTAHRLLAYFVQILRYTQEPDLSTLQDVPLAIDNAIPGFPKTRPDTLVAFLQAVYRFCHGRDGCSHRDVIESLQVLLAGPRLCTPDLAPPAPGVPHQTPFKLKSSIPYSSFHTHNKVDPRLASELERHVWHTRDMSFFDRFFPDVDCLLSPTAFLPDPQQDDLVEWFNGYNRTCREWWKEQNMAKCKWTLKTSPNRPLRHPTTDRNLDIFLYDGASEVGTAEGVQSSSKAAGDHGGQKKVGQPTDDLWDRKHVLVIAEVKCEKKLGDLNRKVVLQLAGYARHVFHRQPDRHWVHGFSVVNTTLCCWLYTRSGAFASYAVDLSTNDGMVIFRRVFNGYLNMTAKEFGVAAPLTTDCTTVGDCAVVCGHPFFTTHAIVTRGMTCRTARPPNDRAWPWG